MPTPEYKKSIGHGKNARGKRLAFSEVTTFRELFSEWKWWRFQEGLSKKYRQQSGVDDYCACHNTDLDNSLHVKARPRVVEWINANMIRSNFDSWYFELVQRRDGILVVVKNNQILASRWLALLNTEQTLREIRHHEI